ncbi:MAG: ComEC/Rec2 family competence protein, partial [Candidatus Levyibacteriota bacterium]
DAILIRTPGGADMLIDAGPTDSVLGCLTRHLPFWDRDIELAFATHPDADHITGFEYVLKSYQVKSFNVSQKTSGTRVFATIQKLLADKNIPVRTLFAGDQYKMGDGVALITDWPTHSFVTGSSASADTNSFSLVQLLSYGKFTGLFTGDIEKELLDQMFQSGLAVDIFKLPHHGSKTGVDQESFRLIKSKLDILSVGLHNRYGHPSPEVMKMLKESKVPYKNTEQGDVEIVTDGKGWQVAGGR